MLNISPVRPAGAATVNERSLVGMGVTINLHVTIGAGARVGNSAVVKADVPQNGIVRAGAIWPVETSYTKSGERSSFWRDRRLRRHLQMIQYHNRLLNG